MWQLTVCYLHFVLLNVCDINLFLVNNKIFAPFWKTLLSAARLFDRFWQLAVSSSWNKLSAVSCLLVQLSAPSWCYHQYWHCWTLMDILENHLVLAEQIVVWPGASLPPLAGCWQCWMETRKISNRCGFQFSTHLTDRTPPPRLILWNLCLDFEVTPCYCHKVDWIVKWSLGVAICHYLNIM